MRSALAGAAARASSAAHSRVSRSADITCPLTKTLKMAWENTRRCLVVATASELRWRLRVVESDRIDSAFAFMTAASNALANASPRSGALIGDNDEPVSSSEQRIE